MGQKVNPKVFRIGVVGNWSSRWFSKVNYASNLEEDIRLKKFFRKELKTAGLSAIEIERQINTINVNLHAAKPGLIIGKGGKAVEDLKKKAQKEIKFKNKVQLNINIKEISKPDLVAEVVLQNMIADLEKRTPYRRVIKRAIEQVRKAGAQGVKVQVAGRLNGAEIARTETLSEGKIPLHTIRANIDYARSAARTTYGAIGVKVWIFKGEVFNKK